MVQICLCRSLVSTLSLHGPINLSSSEREKFKVLGNCDDASFVSFTTPSPLQVTLYSDPFSLFGSSSKNDLYSSGTGMFRMVLSLINFVII